MKKTITILVFILVAAAALYFGLRGPEAPETIRIGVAGAHSGDLASYGISALRGAEYVVRQINDRGGILGKQIELVKEDDLCKPEVATNSATKLVSEGIRVVMGHICSGATRTALGIYKPAKVLVMSPSATNPPLTQSGEYPNFFRTIASDDAQARLEVDFAKKRGWTRIAVLHDKGDYGKGLAEYAKGFIEQDPDLELALYEGITPGGVDYSAVVTKLDQAGAQAVIFGGYHPEASKLVSQMRKKKMETVFISDDGVKDDTFIKVAGEFADGVYATGPKDVSTNPRAVEATRAHRETYKSDPGAFYLNACAATTALLNAIERAGGTGDFDALAKVLRTESVETTLGRIRFDERGDAIGVGFSVYQVRNGAYAEVR
ncbi:MAG: branched-chain amino acid ABC transporter substrate-binding protein [Proteobacteria bacterium]|nr:branched-chain amino acid ABC transporter substrate-binding protein [Pseudomonadota bacterium]